MFGPTVSGSREKILLFLKKKSCTLGEIRKGTKLCKKTISKNLKFLLKEGVIQKRTSKFGKKYFLKSE
jgi:predicted transcriptional regulator